MQYNKTVELFHTNKCVLCSVRVRERVREMLVSKNSVSTVYNYSIWKSWTYLISRLDSNTHTHTHVEEELYWTWRPAHFKLFIYRIVFTRAIYLLIHSVRQCLTFQVNYSNGLTPMRAECDLFHFISIVRTPCAHIFPTQQRNSGEMRDEE